MNKLTDRPPMSLTNKLCLVAMVGCFLAPHLALWAMDAAAYRAAEADKPPSEVAERLPLKVDPMVFYGETPNADLLPPEEDKPLIAENLIATLTTALEDKLFWQTVPLDGECRTALEEACEKHGVPICLALGIIHEESRFDPEAGNDISYGLMGLNKKYYPSDLTPAENIQAGVAHLAGQIERYDGDIQAALRGYNKGLDDGDRTYARRALDASEKWGKG